MLNAISKCFRSSQNWACQNNSNDTSVQWLKSAFIMDWRVTYSNRIILLLNKIPLDVHSLLCALSLTPRSSMMFRGPLTRPPYKCNNATFPRKWFLCSIFWSDFIYRFSFFFSGMYQENGLLRQNATNDFSVAKPILFVTSVYFVYQPLSMYRCFITSGEGFASHPLTHTLSSWTKT